MLYFRSADLFLSIPFLLGLSSYLFFGLYGHKLLFLSDIPLSVRLVFYLLHIPLFFLAFVFFMMSLRSGITGIMLCLFLAVFSLHLFFILYYSYIYNSIGLFMVSFAGYFLYFGMNSFPLILSYADAVKSNNVRRLKLLRLLFPFSWGQSSLCDLLYISLEAQSHKVTYYIIDILSSKTLLTLLPFVKDLEEVCFVALVKDKNSFDLVLKKLGKNLSNDFLYKAINLGNKSIIEKIYDKVDSPDHKKILRLASTLGNEEIFEFLYLKAIEEGAYIDEIIDREINVNIIKAGNSRLLAFLNYSRLYAVTASELGYVGAEMLAELPVGIFTKKIKEKISNYSRELEENDLLSFQPYQSPFEDWFLAKYGGSEQVIIKWFEKLTDKNKVLEQIKSMHMLQEIRFHLGVGVRQFLTSKYKEHFADDEYVFINGNEGEVKPIVSEVLIDQGWPNDLTSIVCEYLLRFELKQPLKNK